MWKCHQGDVHKWVMLKGGGGGGGGMSYMTNNYEECIQKHDKGEGFRNAPK